MEAFSSTFPENRSRQLRIWLGALVLALLLHILWLSIPAEWTLPNTLPPRVELQNIDPNTLKKIRDQWQKEKPVLIHPHGDTAQTAPDDARFSADRNIRVEKEQRARRTEVMPHEGSRARAQPRTEAKPRPALGDLGVKLRLPPKTLPQAQAEERERTSPASDQSLSADDVPEGSENLLNAQESVFYSFYARIYESVGPIWNSAIGDVLRSKPIAVGDYVTRTDVLMDEAGNIARIEVVQRSGIEEFDEAAVFAWKKAAPFTNPPRKLLNERGLFRIGYSFRVHLEQGSMIQLAPQRDY